MYDIKMQRFRIKNVKNVIVISNFIAIDKKCEKIVRILCGKFEQKAITALIVPKKISSVPKTILRTIDKTRIEQQLK